MVNYRKYSPFVLPAILLMLDVAIWYVAVWEDRGEILTVAFLNIGQGDSIFIESPNGNRIMIDGGPASSGSAAVESELGKLLPFYARHLDLIVMTHPDADHVAGLQSILEDYKVDQIMEPGSNTDTATYKKIEETIAVRQIPKTLARRGQRVILDRKRKVYLTILFPDRDVSNFETNDSSIVARLTYGHNSFLLTGDSPQKIEKYLVSLDGKNLKSDVLKPGHHGSKTSTSDEYVASVQPEYAVISAGKNNRYGFPHQQVIDVLNKYHAQILKTYDQGTILFRTDGDHLTIKYNK